MPASGRGFIAAERWKAIDYAKESGPRQADVSPPGTIAAGHGSPHEGLEEAAVTNYMIVKQKVRDLATFQNFVIEKLTSTPNVDTVRTALTIRRVKDEGLVSFERS